MFLYRDRKLERLPAEAEALHKKHFLNPFFKIMIFALRLNMTILDIVVYLPDNFRYDLYILN